MKKAPVIIIGAGGHARVLIDILKLEDRVIIGLVTREKSVDAVAGVPVLGGDDCLEKYPPGSCEVVNGIGSIGDMSARKEIFTRLKSIGYVFSSVVHPSAILATGINLGEGVQMMAGSVIQTGVAIGDNSIINTGSIVDHDSFIGSHVHIAPGVVISGGVRIGDLTHIGTATAVIQGIQIGKEVVIGAGSVVIRDIPEKVTAVGIPAKVSER